MDIKPETSKKVLTEKQKYAIAKKKEVTLNTSMCIAPDKGIAVTHWKTYEIKTKNKKLYKGNPIYQDTEKLTAYLNCLTDISENEETRGWKQCSTGLSSIERNAIIIDVDDDYETADRNLRRVRASCREKFPVPTFKTVNTRTNHVQYMFVTRDSIPYEKEEDKIKYQRVTRLMNAVIGGDLNFRFYQCKNPLSHNPSLKVSKFLPKSFKEFPSFYKFLDLADYIETRLDTRVLTPENRELLEKAKELNEKKQQIINKANEKKKKNRARNAKDPDKARNDVVKNLNKTNRNDSYKGKNTENSRNVLAKDYARKFVWTCMLNDVEVDPSSVRNYLKSKNKEIADKCGKTELLSPSELYSTARCTYTWCLAKFDRYKAKHGSFSDRQRKNSLLIRRDKSYRMAKECMEMRKKGKNISEISRILNKDRNTVRNCLNGFDRLFEFHQKKLDADKKIAEARKLLAKNRTERNRLNSRLALLTRKGMNGTPPMPPSSDTLITLYNTYSYLHTIYINLMTSQREVHSQRGSLFINSINIITNSTVRGGLARASGQRDPPMRA